MGNTENRLKRLEAGIDAVRRGDKDMFDLSKEAESIFMEEFNDNVRGIEEKLFELKNKIVAGKLTEESFEASIKEIISLAKTPSINNMAQSFSEDQLGQLNEILQKQVVVPMIHYMEKEFKKVDVGTTKLSVQVKNHTTKAYEFITAHLNTVQQNIISEIDTVATRVDAIDSPRRLR